MAWELVGGLSNKPERPTKGNQVSGLPIQGMVKSGDLDRTVDQRTILIGILTMVRGHRMVTIGIEMRMGDPVAVPECRFLLGRKADQGQTNVHKLRKKER